MTDIGTPAFEHQETDSHAGNIENTGNMLAPQEFQASPVSSHHEETGNSLTPHFENLPQLSGQRAGIYWLKGKHKEWICSPLIVAARTRDASGGEWGRLLVFADRDGREHRWAMPMSMLAGNGEVLRAELLRQGLEIATRPAQRGKLLDFIQGADVEVAARCVTRTGWHGDAFVLPDRAYNERGEPIIYQATSLEATALSRAGTLEGWRERVSAACAGNSRLVLAVATAFAGPCLGLLEMEGGGLHLRGSSSVGKSTALQVAASVYGPPEFVRTWRQTDNALEGVASLHSDMLLILDEIGELDPKHAGSVAYMLANGQGKGRANRNGAARVAARWRLQFLSSGEISMTDLIEQAGGKVRAGQEVRVLDVPADAGAGYGLFDHVDGHPGHFAEALKASATKHHGHALHALLEGLADNVPGHRAWLSDRVQVLADSMTMDNASGQVRRAAKRFAVIGAAGELATRFGITGWSNGEAERASSRCFAAWLAARETTGNSEPAAMLTAVRGFLDVHGESRFARCGNDAAASNVKTANRAGYVRYPSNEPEYLIFPPTFKQEVARGFDYKAIARLLEEHGALITDPGRLTHKFRPAGGNPGNFFHITPKLWELEL
ncbi:DUF927 domain-containing protein [Pseudoxanthomonas sp.]|uniref:DUF927 domain-containing protein n=1 Tax=Pseudoxanthomonas sp. TaxID=1871049 RepID=UPI002629294F|nr:DUF927 domain-containing protein [Pseudoxanthomonas sp.]WDS35856.1 MAG: DUF927 domain-containing protein [Pseudoxanthomonas sp.]